MRLSCKAIPFESIHLKDFLWFIVAKNFFRREESRDFSNIIIHSYVFCELLLQASINVNIWAHAYNLDTLPVLKICCLCHHEMHII